MVSRMLAFALVVALGAAAAVAAAPTAPCGPPKLVIHSPSSGDTVEAPFPVRYTIRCFKVGGESGGYIRAFIRTSSPRDVELRPKTQSGVVRFPDMKMLSGRRDVTFQLARGDGSLVRRPTARVTLEDLIIAGSRSANG